jgi:hypothetical protein
MEEMKDVKLGVSRVGLAERRWRVESLRFLTKLE